MDVCTNCEMKRRCIEPLLFIILGHRAENHTVSESPTNKSSFGSEVTAAVRVDAKSIGQRRYSGIKLAPSLSSTVNLLSFRLFLTRAVLIFSFRYYHPLICIIQRIRIPVYSYFVHTVCPKIVFHFLVDNRGISDLDILRKLVTFTHGPREPSI